MKRYYIILLALCSLAVIVGLSNRGSVTAYREQTIATEEPKAIYHWNEIEIEPFLYAIPLGVFTPYKTMEVYDYPYGEQTGKVIEATIPSSFTSEYRHGDDLWLCVAWSVDEDVIAWNCSGWVLAESSDSINGIIERDYELPPPVELEQNA